MKNLLQDSDSQRRFSYRRRKAIMQPKLILFDLSDTLIDTRNFFRGRNIKINKKILELFEIKKTEEEILNALKASYRMTEKLWKRELSFFQILCQNLGVKVSKSRAVRMDNLFRKEFLESVRLKSSVQYVLSNLKRRGFIIAIISNYDEKTIIELLRHFRIRKYFSFIIGIDTTGLEKAKLKPFIYALEKTKIEPCEALMVGDDERQDIIPAKRLGMKTIKIKLKELEESSADLIIEDLKDLVDLLC